MVSDFNYDDTTNHRTLRLSVKSDVPVLLKRAITLVLFSRNPNIRSFNGNSIVTAFSSMSQGGFNALQGYLTIAANEIKNILQSLDDTVLDVYFSASDNAPELRVELTVVTTTETSTSVIYNQSIS